MRATKEEKVTVHLELSLEEALWLKGVCQNPINVQNDEVGESSYDSNMRMLFFQAIKDLTDKRTYNGPRPKRFA